MAIQKRKRAAPVEVDHEAVSRKAATNPIQRRQLQKQAAQLAKQLKHSLKIDVLHAPDAADENIACISTGYQAIDDIITGKLDDAGTFVRGAGKGFPRGRIIEIYGPEASAKTSLALSTIAQAQAAGEVCAFIDAEHALDPRYASKQLGLDMGSLIWTQPDSGEEAIETMIWCVRKKVSVIVLDSVSALATQSEMDGGNSLGQQARLMSQACRKISTLLKPGGPIVIFINQIRYKIGVMFANPETTSGGNALKFYSSVRAEVRKKKELTAPGETKGEPRVTGHRIAMRVVKNKLAPCGGRVTFDVLFGKGLRVVKKKSAKQRALEAASAAEDEGSEGEAEA